MSDGDDCLIKPVAPFTWERNRCIPSTFQLLERKVRLLTQEYNDSVSRFVSLHSGVQSSSLPQLFLRFYPIFPATTTPMHALGAKVASFQFLTSSAIHYFVTWEGKRTNAYCSPFGITFFIVLMLGTEQSYLKRSSVNATLERSPLLYRIIRKGTNCVPMWTGFMTAEMNNEHSSHCVLWTSLTVIHTGSSRRFDIQNNWQNLISH